MSAGGNEANVSPLSVKPKVIELKAGMQRGNNPYGTKLFMA